MALRGDVLVYIADGQEEKMIPLRESFAKFLKVPVIIGDITPDMDIRQLREDTEALNKAFGHLVDKHEKEE